MAFSIRYSATCPPSHIYSARPRAFSTPQFVITISDRACTFQKSTFLPSISKCPRQKLTLNTTNPKNNTCPRILDLYSTIRTQHSVLSKTPLGKPPTPVVQPIPQEQSESSREFDQPPNHSESSRYIVRQVQANEVYTVADIRCEAFYDHPKDPYFYPVRRREIYMAMRDRMQSGNKCLVVLDTEPPEQWLCFAKEGVLVVGSLDISLHEAKSGRKCCFAREILERWKSETRRETPKILDGPSEDLKRIYISSMAVRKDWRGRGLAQLLLAYVDDLALKQAIKEIFLHVEWDNKAAVSVYTKCGFCRLGADKLNRLSHWLHFMTKGDHTLMRKQAVEDFT